MNCGCVVWLDAYDKFANFGKHFVNVGRTSLNLEINMYCKLGDYFSYVKVSSRRHMEFSCHNILPFKKSLKVLYKSLANCKWHQQNSWRLGESPSLSKEFRLDHRVLKHGSLRTICFCVMLNVFMMLTMLYVSF